MKNEKQKFTLAETATIALLALVITPVIYGGLLAVGTLASDVGDNISRRRAYRKKIKKGLKDGTIGKIGNKYYDISDVCVDFSENAERATYTISVEK